MFRLICLILIIFCRVFSAFHIAYNLQQTAYVYCQIAHVYVDKWRKEKTRILRGNKLRGKIRDIENCMDFHVGETVCTLPLCLYCLCLGSVSSVSRVLNFLHDCWLLTKELRCVTLWLWGCDSNIDSVCYKITFALVNLRNNNIKLTSSHSVTSFNSWSSINVFVAENQTFLFPIFAFFFGFFSLSLFLPTFQNFVEFHISACMPYFIGNLGALCINKNAGTANQYCGDLHDWKCAIMFGILKNTSEVAVRYWHFCYILQRYPFRYSNRKRLYWRF
jgi:hypothetical protein